MIPCSYCPQAFASFRGVAVHEHTHEHEVRLTPAGERKRRQRAAQRAAEDDHIDAPVAAADTSWRKDAACRHMDPDVFFADRGASVGPAKTVCAGCPVRAACLDYAMATGQKFGVWGGLPLDQERADDA